MIEVAAHRWEDVVLLLLDVVLDAALHHGDGGPEPGSRQQLRELAEPLSGELVLRVGFFDRLVVEDPASQRVDVRLLELHVQGQRRRELLDEAFTLRTRLGLVQLV